MDVIFICSWQIKKNPCTHPANAIYKLIIGFCFSGEGGESARQKCLRDEVILTSNQKNLDSPDLSMEPDREFDAVCEEH